ncbi:MAG: cupin domain-containing protein [Actinobacteria bacterium]|nr:cupin domain-containing protein [Actinomycetota bacterium]
MTGSDETVWFLDTLTIIRASADTTAGRLDLLEQTAPSGHAPPPHKHQREDEWFYILDGELTFWLDGGRSVGGPGSLAFLPKGIPHGFAVTSSDPARFLIGTSPSGFGSFVRAVGTRAESPTLPPADHPMPSPDELGRIAAEHGIELLGPPGLPD